MVLAFIDFGSHDLDGWASISQLVVTGVAVFALIGAIVQTIITRSAHRQALTYNYTARFSDPERIKHYAKTSELFDLDGTDADTRWAEYESWSIEEQLDALVFPNLFEELAGMYNRGLIDKKIAKEFFGTPASAVWENAAWFVGRIRKSDASYYTQWETMLRKMDLL